jgi:hypothetical protein
MDEELKSALALVEARAKALGLVHLAMDMDLHPEKRTRATVELTKAGGRHIIGVGGGLPDTFENAITQLVSRGL